MKLALFILSMLCHKSYVQDFPDPGKMRKQISQFQGLSRKHGNPVEITLKVTQGQNS